MKAEEHILGSLIADFLNYQEAMGLLKPEYFEKAVHQAAFAAIQTLADRSEPVDMVTVAAEMTRQGHKPDKAYIATLTTYILYSPIEAHCLILMEAFLRREGSKVAQEVAIEANDPTRDVFEVLEQGEKRLSNLVDCMASKEISSLGQIRDEVLAEMDRVLTTGRRSGILSGVEALDNHTSGWQPGNLIIIGGRPGMGKTACAITFALNPALKDIPVGFFSLEMPKQELVGRIMSMTSSLNSKDLVNKHLNRDQWLYLKTNTDSYHSVPMFIDDTPGLSLAGLRIRARKLKRKKGIKLVVVDYLQLMSGSGKKGNNREQDMGEISRGLKSLAKELELPIIALAQLNREVENRPSKLPQLSDLRESGAIEQDADMVIFPFRPEYYGIDQYQFGQETIPTNQLLVFIISKYRNGSTGELRARFISTQTLVTNYR